MFPRMTLASPVVRTADTITGQLGVMGARFIMDGGAADGRFSVVEHPIAPRGLAGPVHMHTREDEYSFILRGRWGFLQGDNVVYGEPGDLVYKPRDVWHTFWNAGDEPASLLEIISPAGFEQFFAKMAEALQSGDGVDPAQMLEVAATFGLKMDLEATVRVIQQHNLVMEGLSQG